MSASGMFASTSEGKGILIRAVSIAGLSMVAVTVLLMIPPLASWREFVSPIHLALMVPQAVPLAIPIGLVIGLAFGARGRALSGGTTRAILLVAFLSSIVSFATLVWLMPAANQEFRQQVFAAMGNRGTVMKGFSEMSVRELEAEIASAKSLGSERGARRVAWHYHLKLSLAFASFVLAMFALATVGRGACSHARLSCSPRLVIGSSSGWANGLGRAHRHLRQLARGCRTSSLRRSLCSSRHRATPQLCRSGRADHLRRGQRSPALP